MQNVRTGVLKNSLANLCAIFVARNTQRAAVDSTLDVIELRS